MASQLYNLFPSDYLANPNAPVFLPSGIARFTGTPDFMEVSQPTPGNYTIHSLDNQNLVSFQDSSAPYPSDLITYGTLTVLDPATGFVEVDLYQQTGTYANYGEFVVGYNANSLLLAEYSIELPDVRFEGVERNPKYSTLYDYMVLSLGNLDHFAGTQVFGQTGPSLLVPEPSGVALMAVATVAFIAARVARRFV